MDGKLGLDRHLLQGVRGGLRGLIDGPREPPLSPTRFPGRSASPAAGLPLCYPR